MIFISSHKRALRSIAFSIVGFLLIAAPLLTQAQPAFVKDSLDHFIAREMARWQVPGLAIAIIKDGKVVHSKGYGVRDVKTKKPVNELTLFQIASNSKAFTGTAIAQLQEEKKLHLDSPVTRYLPWFSLYDPSSTQLCTVRDVLTHRIGHGTFQGDFLNWGSNLTRKEIVERMRLTQPKYPFRYQYGYCNAGYITAGEIILASTGKTWDEYLKSQFFDPLEMQHTHTSYPAMKADTNACKPYTIYLDKLEELPLANIDNMGASASINSCVADMANWLIMQLDNGKFNGKQIVSSQVLRETRKSSMIVRDNQSKLFPSKHFGTYGLGWASYDYNGRRVYEHSGGANGFVTKTEFIPEEKLGVIVYTNSDANSLYDALVKQVIEAYMGMPYRNVSALYYEAGASSREAELRFTDSLMALSYLNKQNKIAPEIKNKDLQGYYENPFYGKIAIYEKKGVLYMAMQHHPDNIATLEYVGDNQYLTTYSDKVCGIQLSMVKREGNRPLSITIKVADFIDYESYEFRYLGIPAGTKLQPEKLW